MESKLPTVNLRDYVDAGLLNAEKSLSSYKVEVERRLVALNDLRKEVLVDRQQFVSQEVYNTTEAERSKWREVISQRITVIETRSVTWTTAIGIFFTLIQLMMWVAFYFIGHH